MVASIIGLSALTIECTKREAKNTRNDLAFDVNEKLLGDSYLDSISNMTLRVPIGWKDSDYTQMTP